MRLNSVLASSILGFAILLTATVPLSAMGADTKVVVENKVTAPVPVHEVNGAASQAFEAQVSLNLADGVSGANGFVTIPSGKRLVIQYASAWAQVPSGQTVSFSIQTMFNGDTQFTPHYLPVLQQNTDAIYAFFVAGSEVHLYSDAPQVNLRIDRGSTIAGAVVAYISISGYLTDQ